jgi:ABC-2 type transport system permease protein
MLTVFRYAILRTRTAVISWGAGLSVLGIYLVTFYENIIEVQTQINLIMQMFPKELLVFFGDADSFMTPSGFLHLEFFSYMPIILGLLFISWGANLLVGDEEKGYMDLILSHPISRFDLFFGRVLANLGSMFAVLVIVWISTSIVIYSIAMPYTFLDMSRPFLSLFVILIFYNTLALFFSMFFPSTRLSNMLTSILLIASFFITSLSKLDEKLIPFAKMSPMTYYQGGDALNDFEWLWACGLFGISLLLLIGAWLLFKRRDIRVSGEGSWRLPILTNKSKI